jgi:hypothetical protein
LFLLRNKRCLALKWDKLIKGACTGLFVSYPFF